MKVTGGKKLSGTVTASGAKNSALPLLFSTILSPGIHKFENVPKLKDIESTLELLQSLGFKTEQQGNTVTVNASDIKSTEAHYDLVRKMRASILCLGPLLARFGEAVVSLPGGCAIGTRPIDLHLDGLKAMGAELEIKDGYVLAKAKKLQGAHILFETQTVGGTENLLMAATLAQGETVLENAAKEPEIVDLANCLIARGAKIQGAGTSVITVQGVTELKPANHKVIPDRIEVGTLLIAAAITKGNVRVEKSAPEDLRDVLEKLKQCGFEITTGKDWIELKTPAQKDFRCKSVDLTTAPHPLFPTDLQAQFMALMTQADGTSVISETIFENRFMHVQELLRLGADISPKTRVAVVRGLKNKTLSGAQVMATDLRASASLVLAGLAATGETIINRIYHLDRGYEELEKKLSTLGAQIERV